MATYGKIQAALEGVVQGLRDPHVRHVVCVAGHQSGFVSLEGWGDAQRSDVACSAGPLRALLHRAACPCYPVSSA